MHAKIYLEVIDLVEFSSVRFDVSVPDWRGRGAGLSRPGWIGERRGTKQPRRRRSHRRGRSLDAQRLCGMPGGSLSYPPAVASSSDPNLHHPPERIQVLKPFKLLICTHIYFYYYRQIRFIKYS